MAFGLRKTKKQNLHESLILIAKITYLFDYACLQYCSLHKFCSKRLENFPPKKLENTPGFSDFNDSFVRRKACGVDQVTGYQHARSP